MANETESVVQTEPTAPAQATNPVAQPSQSLTASIRKPRAKRGRPRKGSSTALGNSSLNRAGRRASKKNKAPAPKASMLNKLVNGSIVIAVFVTALAIQRIVPTEHVAVPKVETLSAQATPAPAQQAPATVPASVTPAAAPTAPQTVAATATALAPQAAAPVATKTATPPVAALAMQPCVAPAPQAAVAKAAAPAPRKTVAHNSRHLYRNTNGMSRIDDNNTALNSGGTEDLDSAAAREHYIKTSKLAKRTELPK